MPTTKTCTRCLTKKNLDDFPKGRSKNVTYHTICKECQAIASAIRHASLQHKEPQSWWPSTQLCTTCLTDKPLEDFNILLAGKFGRFRKCKACMAIARRKKYIEDPTVFHKSKASWRTNNPLSAKVSDANYRHKRRTQIGTDRVEPEEWAALCEFYSNRCLRCDTLEKDIVPCGTITGLTMDHVIPLSKGGRHLIENLQPLCVYCNSHKLAKILDHVDYRGLFNFNLYREVAA